MAHVTSTHNYPMMLVRDTRGSFVMIFGLLLVPLMGLLGLAVDYSQSNRVKTALDSALDAAVLSTLTTASQLIQSEESPTNQNPDVTAASITAGTNVFTASVSTLQAVTSTPFASGQPTVSYPTPTITLARNGLQLVANGTYVAGSINILGEIFGSNTWPITGGTTAALSLPPFQTIYFLLDNSQSMGIASNNQYMSELQAYTGVYGETCQFGCHVTDGISSSPISFEQIAKNNNILLRIDSLRTAVQKVIGIASSTQIANSSGGATSTTRIRIGLYTMSTKLTTVSAPSTDYTTLLSDSNKIDLDSSTPQGTSGPGDSPSTSPEPGSPAADNLTQFYNLLNAQGIKNGDGTTYATPEVFIFVITDGLNDTYSTSCVYTHCTSVYDVTKCALLKNLSKDVGVIYTTYTPFPSDARYQALVAPIAGNISTALKSCATTTSYYVEANTGDEITQAVQSLFQLAASSGTLSQ